MTKIYYECKNLKEEIVFITVSLQEARNFVQKNGGHFIKKEVTTQSTCEPYCMKRHRTVLD